MGGKESGNITVNGMSCHTALTQAPASDPVKTGVH